MTWHPDSQHDTIYDNLPVELIIGIGNSLLGCSRKLVKDQSVSYNPKVPHLQVGHKPCTNLGAPTAGDIWTPGSKLTPILDPHVWY